MHDLTIGEMFIRFVIAALVGGIVGYEREVHEKGAGLRTHMLMSMGACLFAMIVIQMTQIFGDNADPVRVVQGLLLSIGFIAGGVIFTRGSSVTGLTTAAGLWVITGAGLAVGLGFFALAGIAAFMTFFIIGYLKRLEDFIHKYNAAKRAHEIEQHQKDQPPAPPANGPTGP